MPETRKSRPKPGLFDRLTLGVSAAYAEPIKAVAAAMTMPLYTQPIKSRKPLNFLKALCNG